MTVVAIAPESKSSIEASTRFVGSRFTQTFDQMKRNELDGVRPYDTDETSGSMDTAIGRFKVKVEGEGEQWRFSLSSP